MKETVFRWRLLHVRSVNVLKVVVCTSIPTALGLRSGSISLLPRSLPGLQERLAVSEEIQRNMVAYGGSYFFKFEAVQSHLSKRTLENLVIP
jgi:hypothetical protein